ncbi:MAG: hypothetical protein JNM63_05160 [Spirochaetia bacterium]|nr:hypothetical protein [Spirochaetia bacterium]
MPVLNLGNLKILPQENIPKVSLKTERPLIITFGSSHEGEEALLVNALREQLVERKVLVILIPRHPDRSKELKKTFSKLRVLLWSEKPDHSLPADIDLLIVDEMGLSHSVYQHSDVVLIGDTFKPSQGGHNFLEPIFFKKPVVYGMNMISFSDLTPEFEKAGAVLRVSPDALKMKLVELLADPERRREMGEKGYSLLQDLEFKKELFLKNLLD